jgi:hypothetical protein
MYILLLCQFVLFFSFVLKISNLSCSLKNIQALLNAGETAFWTKLNWKSICKSGGNLRLIVNSKTVVLGSTNFSSDDLLNAVSDDKGLRRVSSCSLYICVTYWNTVFIFTVFAVTVAIIFTHCGLFV